MTDSSHDQHSEILPISPPQKIFSRYQSDFAFHHDRGFYLSAVSGPQWNQSLEKPQAKGLRFGGKVNAGWFIADGLPLFISAWGNFLEDASLVAVGPGMGLLFDKTNMGLDFSLGIGRAFNVLTKEKAKDFSEMVMAANMSAGKFWWTSEKTSLGFMLSAGVHGFTLSEAKISSFGWSVGLGLAFILG